MWQSRALQVYVYSTACNTNRHAQCKGTRATIHLSLSVQPLLAYSRYVRSATVRMHTYGIVRNGMVCI